MCPRRRGCSAAPSDVRCDGAAPFDAAAWPRGVAFEGRSSAREGRLLLLLPRRRAQHVAVGPLRRAAPRLALPRPARAPTRGTLEERGLLSLSHLPGAGPCCDFDCLRRASPQTSDLFWRESCPLCSVVGQSMSNQAAQPRLHVGDFEEQHTRHGQDEVLAKVLFSPTAATPGCAPRPSASGSASRATAFEACCT
jgi:hypothetical protein